MQLIHEVQDQRHRIICLNKDGTSHTGDWFSQVEVATLDIKKKSYYAICGESVLPQGIFTATQQSHQVLA